MTKIEAKLSVDPAKPNLVLVFDKSLAIIPGEKYEIQIIGVEHE
jgi:hypothetical protein